MNILSMVKICIRNYTDNDCILILYIFPKFYIKFDVEMLYYISIII